MTPEEQKTTIRSRVSSRLKGLGGTRREALSRPLRDALADCDALRQAEIIMAFAPLSTEPIIDPVLDRWRSEGRKVLLPRTLDAPGMMELAPLECLMSELPIGPFGVRTPQGPSHQGKKPEVILVPGVAFDHQGRRLGHGGGYYDRLLAEAGAARVLGLGFECQLESELPEEDHDQRVHGLVTEQGIREFT